MANDIQTYLRELQAAMAAGGADPALVQDALFDAEEHLQAEMAAGGAVERGTASYEARFAAVAEGYGSPAEVAAAYTGVAPAQEALVVTAPRPVPEAGPVSEPRPATPTAPAQEGPATSAAPATQTAPATGGTPVLTAAPATEQSRRSCRNCGRELSADSVFCAACGTAVATPSVPTTPVGVQAGMAAAASGAGAPPSALRQVFGVFADPAVYKALIYMLLSLATGIAYFIIVVAGMSTCVPLLILIIGIPLFLLFLGAVRGIALFEGRLVEWLLGTRMPRRPRATPPNAGIMERIGFWLKDGRTWASMAYMLLMLPLGIVYFTIAVAGLASGLGLLASPLWAWAAWGRENYFIHEGVTYSWTFHWWLVPLVMIAGAVILTGVMHLVRWIGRGHAAFAKAMLVRLAK